MSFLRTLVFLLAACLFADVARSEDAEAPLIDGWGQVVDPDHDCTVEGDSAKLTITVPSTNHNLNPAISANAPRVLQRVNGDFTATVKVTGDFKPSQLSTLPSGLSFNGAGLLIWKDDKNYLRLERNIWWRPDGATYGSYMPLVEYYKDGKYQNTNPPGTSGEFFKGRSTYLRLERKGDKVTASYSHDGNEWTVAKELRVDLPSNVEIGVAAISTSHTPFRVEFKEFKVAQAK